MEQVRLLFQSIDQVRKRDKRAAIKRKRNYQTEYRSPVYIDEADVIKIPKECGTRAEIISVKN